MVRARIHIICGNCGCGDMWEFQIVRDGIDLDGENFKDAAWLKCGNCATLHTLENKAVEARLTRAAPVDAAPTRGETC